MFVKLVLHRSHFHSREEPICKFVLERFILVTFNSVVVFVVFVSPLIFVDFLPFIHTLFVCIDPCFRCHQTVFLPLVWERKNIFIRYIRPEMHYVTSLLNRTATYTFPITVLVNDLCIFWDVLTNDTLCAGAWAFFRENLLQCFLKLINYTTYTCFIDISSLFYIGFQIRFQEKRELTHQQET